MRLMTFIVISASLASTTLADGLKLALLKDTYTLSTFDGVAPRSHYFGEYRFLLQDFGGTKLHLFPNGEFVISEWVDVGPDEFQASGTFAVEGERLKLNFVKTRTGKEELAKRFSGLFLQYGTIEKENYVTGFEVFIFAEAEWNKLKEKPENFQFMQRIAEYNDWEQILRDYVEQKE